MSEKLGVGIIGCGGIANAKHIPNLLKLENVEITGVCDAYSRERAEAAVSRFGIKNCTVYDSVDELLNGKNIDVVHVCTPNESHAPITIAALNAGKHVMCEKPMACNVTQAADMLAAARASGRKLTICANNRFSPVSWQLKQLCDNNELGDIYYARAHAVRRRGVPTWGDFLNRDAQGGGPVIDIGIHALDLALWFMNNYEPKFVLGRTYDRIGKLTSPANPYGNWEPAKFTVEDFGVAMIVMKNGATIMLEASWALNILDEKTAKVTLCGTLAGADMNDGLTINGEHAGKLYNTKVLTEPAEIPFYKPNQVYGPELELRRWADAVLNDREPVVKPEQMYTATRIVHAIYESDRTGQPVFF